MSDYTPTLRALRVAWVASAAPESTAEVHRLQAMFDRAVAAHDRELRAEVERLRSALDNSAVGHGIAVAHAGDWKYRAEMAEAERDRLRAAVEAVRGVAARVERDNEDHLGHFGQHVQGSVVVVAEMIRAALDEHLGED